MSNILLIKNYKQSNYNFDDEILADLINEGYSGTALLEEFKARQQQIKQAIKAMLDDAKAAAEGKAESYSISDAFDED